MALVYFRKHKLTAFVITLVFVVIAFIVFALKISSISVQKGLLETSTDRINDTVKVYTNHYGIPHIIASNEHDAFFMAGYMHAKDRLWQMDYLRRLGRGTLSEILGKETFNVDLLMRAIDFGKTANQIWKNCDPQSRKILEAYSDGVNSFIDHNKTRLPFEFNALNYIPKHWHPTDSYVISRLIAFSMSSGFSEEITFGKIADRIGVRKALELIPSYPAYAACITDDSMPKSQKGQTQDSSKLKKTASVEGLKIMKSLAFLSDDLSKYFGFGSDAGGSNCWVVKKDWNLQSKTVLANDPHLQISVPSRWYQMHLTYKNFNVTGLNVPGTPLFMIGRNNNIAWGITNLMLDDFDYFIERVDSANKNVYYSSSGTKEKFTFVRDTIKVKNSKDFYYYRKYGKRSAVISDVYLQNYLPKNPDDVLNESFFKKYCLTFSWTGQNTNNDLKALYYLNKAKDWNQFQSALTGWASPALCFTFTDNGGNMGIVPAGLVPKRKQQPMNIPNPGWLEGYAWEGFINCSELPKIFNPMKKYIVSANNKYSRNYAGYLSSYWHPQSRAERITDLLHEHAEYSAREAQIMQSDVLSNYSKRLLASVIPILNQMTRYMTDKENTALDYLKKWDNIMSPNSVGAAIFNVFYEKLVYNTFADELGDAYYKDYIRNGAIPARKIMELVADSTVSSDWFDDIKTPQREYKNYIIMKSLRDAAETIEKVLDEDELAKWNWGKLHTITFRHVFTNEKFFAPTVNSGPYPIGGNLTTINNTGMSLPDSYEANKYSSMRFVTDMEENCIYSCVPGGESGDPQSPNYRDQLQLWLNGGFVKISTLSLPDADYKLSILFYPKN